MGDGCCEALMPWGPLQPYTKRIRGGAHSSTEGCGADARCADCQTCVPDVARKGPAAVLLLVWSVMARARADAQFSMPRNAVD
jgi:hypothetical protein